MPRGSSAVFDPLVKFRTAGESGQRPPGQFGQADAVFAGDDAPQASTCRNRSFSAAWERFCAPGFVGIHHHVDVDVAIARMAETGDRQAVLFLQSLGKGKQILQPAAREPRCPRSIWSGPCRAAEGKFPAQFPDRLALPRA